MQFRISTRPAQSLPSSLMVSSTMVSSILVPPPSTSQWEKRLVLYCPTNKVALKEKKMLIQKTDLLGVPDKDVWSYGQSLRSLALSRSYTTLSFSRLRDLVPLPHHSLQKALLLDDDLDEMTYVANATNFRRSLLNEFSRPDWQWSEVKESEDVCLTYRGYIKFLETDLQYVYPVGEGRTKSRFKKGIEAIAKEMLMRGDVSYSSSLQLTSSIYRHPYQVDSEPNVNTGLCKRRPQPLPIPPPPLDPPFLQHLLLQTKHQPPPHNKLNLHHPLALHRRLHPLRRASLRPPLRLRLKPGLRARLR